MPRLQRQLALFVLGVLIPGAVLLAFGLMLVRQEGELETRRNADALSIRARATADSLLAGLEADYRLLDSLATRWSARYPAETGLLNLGEFIDGDFEAAWAPPSPHPLSGAEYGSVVQRALRAEIGSRNPAGAARILSARLATESDSTRAVDLRLRLARVLFASGRADEAERQARLAAAASPDLIDEYGSPISLYAIELLAVNGVGSLCVELERMASSDVWISPGATDYLFELITMAECEMPGAAGSRREEAALAAAVTGMGDRIVADREDARWAAIGDHWLLRRVDGDRREAERVVAVPLDELRRRVDADSVWMASVARPATASARTLAPALPMVRVRYAETAPPVVARRTLYAIAVVLVLFMTVFGGWLLWADVRRETRLSNLRSQFVASVSHELRTPLTSIRLFSEAMLEYGARDPEQQERGLRVIAYESGRLTRMLNNVLNTTRIERGTMSYSPEPGDLADSAESAIAAMQYPFDDAGVDIERDLQLAQGTFDPDAMEQAVLNLLSNALKYASAGGRVQVRTWEENGHAAVSVKDFGPGVDPEDRERIFERFYRAQRETDLRTTGAGLGLALVQHIAQGHGGDIVLQSTPGEGSEFIIQIPRSA